MEYKLFRIRTAGSLRLGGYLHNAVEKMNSGPHKTNTDSSWIEDLNQGPPDFKSSALNHSAMLLPYKSKTDKTGLIDR